MKRGDVVVAAAPDDYGKPRPYLVVQADHFAAHPSTTLLMITTALQSTPLFRITIDPSPRNGLRRISQVAVDKVVTLPSARIAAAIGALDPEQMLRVTRALASWLGIAG